jgi:hypothetical protein
LFIAAPNAAPAAPAPIKNPRLSRSEMGFSGKDLCIERSFSSMLVSILAVAVVNRRMI